MIENPSGLSNRVLLVAPQPFFRNSGTPLNVLNICRALTSNGYEVDLLTIPGGQLIEMPGLNYHRAPAIPFLSNVPIGFSGAKAVYDIALAVKLTLLLTRRTYLAIHAIEESAFFAAPLAKLFGVHSIVDMDSDIQRNLLNSGRPIARLLAPTAHFLRRHALRLSSCSVTVARRLSEIVARESPATPIFEIRDIAIPETLLTPRPARLSRLKATLNVETDHVVVYTGNFDSRQGIDLLLNAIPIVRRFIPDMVFVLVGGSDRQVREATIRVEELGCPHAVRLTGHRPIQEMHEFMALAGALVSPRTEPYVTPLKVYSYMASGRPIVATDMPMHTEVLDSNSAILVSLTKEGLADGILSAFENRKRSRSLAMNAQRLARRRHSYEVFERQIGDLYSFIKSIAVRGQAEAQPSGLQGVVDGDLEIQNSSAFPATAPSSTDKAAWVGT